MLCDQTVIPNLNEKYAFRTVKIDPQIDFLPKYQGLDGSLISSFELSDDSSGGYFRNFMTGCVGQTLKTLPVHVKPKPEPHTYSYNLA